MVGNQIDNPTTRRAHHPSRLQKHHGLLHSWQLRSMVILTAVLILASGWISKTTCSAQNVNNNEEALSENQEHKKAADQPANNNPDENALTPEQQADFALWKSAMTENTDIIARRRAAGKLLASGWQPSLHLLTSLLQNKDQTGVITAIADAVSEQESPPSAIFRPLLNAYEKSENAVRESLELAITAFPPEEAIPAIAETINHKDRSIADRVALVGLLSRFVEVQTIDALIPILDKSEPSPLRQAAAEALATITGVDLGESRLRWQDWWMKNRNAGREGLLTANIKRLQNELKTIRKRDRQYRDERTTLIDSIEHWIEQAYALEPKDNRPDMLVSLLGDEREEIRLLGLRLIEQAMSNGEPMPAEVTNAVAECVDDAVVEVRAEAIRQLLFLDGQRAGALAANRIKSETDITARLALESILARYPSEDGGSLLLKIYLDDPGRNALEQKERTAIATALLAAFRVSKTPQPEQRRRLTQIIMGDLGDLNNENNLQNAIKTLSTEEAGLLAWSPDEIARKACRIILANQPTKDSANPSEDSHQKQIAVARELAASGLDDEALYQQAANPDIHPIAFGVLLARKGPLKTLTDMLHDFKVPDEKTRQNDINTIMATLPVKDWVAADDLLEGSQIITIDQRAAWLSRVLTLDTTDNTTSANPSTEITQNPVAPVNTGEGVPTKTSENQASNNTKDNSGDPQSTGTTTTSTETGMIRRRICLRLAQLQLKRGIPADALVALKAAPAARENQELADHLWAVAKIANGDFNQPLPANNKQAVTVWMEALSVVDHITPKDDQQLSILTDRKKSIAMKIRELGEDQLNQADQARITALLGEKDNQPLEKNQNKNTTEEGG